MNQLPKNASFVDVRQREEFAAGHYPNAINIPLGEINLRIDELKKMKLPIIAYCQSGARSDIATSIIQKAGIMDVLNGGGLTDLLSLK